MFVLPIPMAEKCDSNKTTMRAPKSTFFRAKSANVAQVQSLAALAPIVCLASLFMANSAHSKPADPLFISRGNFEKGGRRSSDGPPLVQTVQGNNQGVNTIGGIVTTTGD